MMRTRRGVTSIRETRDGLVFRSPYNAALVAALKLHIPHSDRRWDPDAKAWIVAPQHAQRLVDFARQYLGETVSAPAAITHAKAEIRLLRLEYLGAPKDRGAEVTAFGWCDSDWSVIFPLSALENWFCVEQQPVQGVTLYATLGIKQDVGGDEIKTAFRRLARQWHPDVCKEPDAAEQFKALRAAYDVLSDSMSRARYDAGLQLATTVHGVDYVTAYLSQNAWRPPLRCGWLLVEGAQQVGRFVVSRIIQWEDITNERGETMVSYWPAGATQFEVKWV